MRIRRLTPRECFRLQGFPDWAYDRAENVSSKSQLYKQAGNSVTVTVIEAIAREFRKIEEEENMKLLHSKSIRNCTELEEAIHQAEVEIFGNDCFFPQL